MTTPDATDETVDAPGGAAKPRGLEAGGSLGKYRLDRVLGTGGMGVVWAAHDPDLERAVALKVLRYENAAVELRTRLLREARAMARLKHPNVLTVYEVDSEGDRDFIAMELVDGASLDGWLASRPSRDEVWQALLAAGRGLAAAHRAGLVHRDFKPHNVLRSHDGRVLVTDFGLARGLGDAGGAAAASHLQSTSGLEETLDAPASGSRDATLTETGTLVGTPAYMAPEQFLGAASDPRTDQFAFCVTAWQLLAGERPFRGTTLDELRRAASAGICDGKADIPRAIRRVLVRGLDPDPTKRWPDMHALLAALERAKARPRRAMQLGFTAVGVAFAVALVVKLTAHEPAADASACSVSPDDEIAKAWAPAMRADLVKTFGDIPAVGTIADEFDAFAARWRDDYASACASPRTTRTFAKLGCLLGERDAVAEILTLVPMAPKDQVAEAEMGGILPRPEACDGDTPATPPSLPTDAKRQAAIRALRPTILLTRFQPPKVGLAVLPGMLAQAESIGWDPLIAEAHRELGLAAEWSGDHWELARDQFKAAIQIARRAHHDQLVAETTAELLFTELDATSDPADDKLFGALVADATFAVHAAGDDPAFLGRIRQSEAVFARWRGRFDEAIAKYEEARALHAKTRDHAAAMRAGLDVVETLLRRDRPDDLAAAWTRLVELERSTPIAKLAANKLRRLDATFAFVARLRGDYATAHERGDRVGPPDVPQDAVPISGRVVGADGQGVGNATVVAWRGLLAGDAARIYVRSRFDGDLATTRPDGTFAIRAPRDGGIIAELGDRRAQPRSVADGVTLTLEPTRAIAGRVACDTAVPIGVIVKAHHRLGPSTAWDLFGPVARSGDYRLAGIPPGGTLRLDMVVGRSPMRKFDFGPVRDDAPLRWPRGPAIDAIVHGDFEAETTIDLLRGSQVAKTRADLNALAERATDVIIHPALVIGIGDQTAEGTKRYARGDRHAVLFGIAPGTITVCAAGAAATSPATCQTLDVRAGASAIPVVLQR